MLLLDGLREREKKEKMKKFYRNRNSINTQAIWRLEEMIVKQLDNDNGADLLSIQSAIFRQRSQSNTQNIPEIAYWISIQE